jgi:hypothetical protein
VTLDWGDINFTTMRIDVKRRLGHGDIGALEEIDRAFQGNVRALRPVNSDATGMQKAG